MTFPRDPNQDGNARVVPDPGAPRPASLEPPYDVVGAIMSFEQGDLDDRESLDLFSHLVRTGQAWSLQGSYGRAAASLIDSGLLDADGTINHDLVEAALA